MSRTIIGGLAINFIMIIFIVLIVIYGVVFPMAELEQCETKQSRFCYSIQCPCDIICQQSNSNCTSDPPCFGYAKMPSGDGNWYCSSAPFTKVDDNGNIL